jgi:hypothetical protein
MFTGSVGMPEGATRVEKSPERRKRDRRRRKAEERGWASRSGPVTVRFVSVAGDGWEAVGAGHPSLASAEGTVKWLESMKRRSEFEYSAATLEDGSHRVLRRPAPAEAGAVGGTARTRANA